MSLRLDALLIRGQLLALLGLAAAQAFGMTQVSSLLFTLTFPLTLGIWLMRAASGISRQGMLGVLTVLAAVCAVAVNALLSETAVDVSYFRKVIMFSTTLLLFASLQDFVPPKELVKWVLRWNTALALFFLGSYILQGPQMHLLNGRESVYLTFRFTSPNLTAVFLSAVCMLESIRAAAAVEKREKGFHLLLAVVMGGFVLETRARNAQLLLLLYFLGAVLLGRRRRIPKAAAVLTAVLPILFAAAYLMLVDAPAVREGLSFLAGEGKGLDSRRGIWQFAWEAFWASPLAGAYSQISGGTGASQMHNSHLDVLASYGILVFIMFCRFLYGLLAGECRGRTALLCRLAFGALLLSGLGEAMLFSGGMGIYLFPGILLMLANFDFDAYEDPVL